jgi:uncharacterized damage-inducible protein DinB
MPEKEILSLAAPEGFRSKDVAWFLAQLEDQTHLLTDDTRTLTPEELEWQPAPGMNTIGMLLAHMAIVEVWWNDLILADIEKPDIPDTLAFGEDDDGMPLPEGGLPPATLAGKPMAFYDDLLARARAHLIKTARTLSDADLDRPITRIRANGQERQISRRWVLYHLLEHFIAHYGQILLLRHQYRSAVGAGHRSQ